MKKSLFFAALLALAAAFFNGCCSVEVAHTGKDMVEVSNSGCYLFYWIPIFSGDPEYPNQQVSSWFTNTVKIETNIKLLEEEAASQGARGVKNLVSHLDDERIILLLLKRKTYHTSAELVR